VLTYRSNSTSRKIISAALDPNGKREYW
jgi:hypothetical protein